MAETDDSAPTRPYSPSLGEALPVLDLHAQLNGPVRLGRYVVLEVLGAGGMGVVYTAYDPQLDRKVALKVLRPMVAGAAAEGWQARLLREARAMARLSHPNVVHVHDAGEADGEVYVAMERVEGVDLRRWLRGGNRPWREALELLLQAGRGLEAAHRAGLVHRDFKPENVLIGRDGRVCVTDFGLAAIAETHRGEGEELTPAPAPRGSMPSIVGTPEYVAPEQLWGAPSDPLADQFSFCVTAYEALYGQRPFAGDNAAQLAHAAARGEVPPAPPGATVPAWVRAAVLRGLAGDPRHRHPSMEALLAALTPAVPLKRRRWLRVSVSLAAVALAFVTLWGWNEERLRRACEVGGDRFAGVWDAATRERIRAAFEATGTPTAAESFERLSTGLDQYVQGWGRARTAICVATRVHGLVPEPLMAERLRCLEARASELHAVTRLFASADADTVLRAGQAVSGLESTGACASLFPAEGAARAHSADDAVLRTKLAEGRALQKLGRYTEAVAKARELPERARAAGAVGIAAEALLLDCETQLLMDAPDRPPDGPCLEAALAAEEAGREELAVFAWTTLVSVATNQGQHQEARKWLRVTQSLARRLGPGHPEAEARLRSAEAFSAFGSGDYAQAAEAWEAALALRDRLLPESGWDRAALTANLGMALMRKGDTERAIATTTRALEMHREILGEGHPELANLYTFLAMAHRQAFHLEEARALFARSIELRRQFEGTESRPWLELGNLGTIDLERGAFAAALPILEESQRLREEALGKEHPFVAAVLLNRGNVLRNLGRLSEAAPLVEQAVAMRETKNGATHPLTGEAYLELVGVRRAQGRPAEALTLALKALDIATQAYGQDNVQTALSLTSLAEALLDVGRTGEALEAAKRGAALLGSSPERHAQAARAERTVALALKASGDLEGSFAAAARADAHLRRYALPEHPMWLQVKGLLAPVRAAR